MGHITIANSKIISLLESIALYSNESTGTYYRHYIILFMNSVKLNIDFSTYSLEELSKGLLKAKEKKIWNEDGPGSIDKASRLASNLLMKLKVQILMMNTMTPKEQ